VRLNRLTCAINPVAVATFCSNDRINREKHIEQLILNINMQVALNNGKMRLHFHKKTFSSALGPLPENFRAKSNPPYPAGG